ncbi:nitronate monooxygenase [candidate division KSB1 bacterium]|nr:nitronate monooxygenase [candidate division KSB1 bacterium]
MVLPKLTIGNMVADVPIVQGGMGVRVSLSSLAAAVANAGGIGTISSIGLGDIKASETEYERISREALIREIRKAKSMTNGHLAVNIMGVLSNADDLVRTAVAEGIGMVVYGAGLPTKLPEIAGDANVNLVPIVSSARVAELIMRMWDKRYDRTVDGFILEGPMAGGHLGFSLDQLDAIENHSLDLILPQILDVVKPYEVKYGRSIPIITAGGIYDGQDIARMLSFGAAGVQMGSRFVCTDECGVSQEFKQAYLDAKEDDIVIIKSPVGMPGRAIRNKFLIRVEGPEKQRIKCRYRCLTACKVASAKYCIAEALVKSYEGDVDNGLIFCGKNAYRIDKIVSVKTLMDELIAGVRSAEIPELKAA